jgi:transcriptional regulator EpsA
MSGSHKLTDQEREYLSEIVETSMRVVNRHQFFVWTQGTMQRLIPHEILVCGLDDGARRGFEHYHFEATRYFREHHFAALCQADTGLQRYLQQISKRTGNPVVVSPSLQPGTKQDPLELDLQKLVQDNELKNLAACLCIGPRTKVQAFYSFSRIDGLSERTPYFLELLVPCVHATFLRVVALQEANNASTGARSGRLVTRRQEEILGLIRDGKTNTEIASILEVSPWTIKSHIQTIFQRLNSNNRTQAITRAISLGILRSE